MKTRIMLLLFALALLFVPDAAPAMMNILDGKAGVDASGEFGYQYKDEEGDRPSRFEAYRDVEKGFIFDSFHLYGTWNDPKRPAYLRLDARDLSQGDQAYRAEAGMYGLFKLKFGYKETPRVYSRGNRFMGTYRGNGRITFDPALRFDLTDVDDDGAVPPGDADDVPPTLVAVPGGPAQFVPFDALRNKLAAHIAQAGEIDLKFKREETNADFTVQIAPGLTGRINYVHQEKHGNRVTSSGVYDRSRITDGGTEGNNVPDNGLIDDFEAFRVVVYELPEPISWYSDLLTAGVQLARGGCLVNLDYNFERFENTINSLRWDNPFRGGPGVADIVTGGNARLRGIASTDGLQVLPPDMYSHGGTLTGSFELPMNSRLVATLSGKGIWQDDDFFPFSVNDAMVVDNSGLPAASIAALPQRDLDGFVMNLVQNYVLTSKPIDPLALTAKYRYYYWDNDSDRIDLPGYAELADSQWFTEDLTNKTPAYLRQNASLEADYTVTKLFQVRADYGWERWRRWERNVRNTDEHRFGGGVTVNPLDYIKVMADYHYSKKDGSDYRATSTSPTNIEAASARMFDQSDRERQELDARVMFTVLDNLDFCATGSAFKDNYRTDRLGISNVYGWNAGGGLTFSFAKGWTISADYEHEDSRTKKEGGAKTSAIADATLFTDANFWDTKVKDRTDSFGVSLMAAVVPDFVDFSTGYNYIRGKGGIFTVNAQPLVADDTINSAIALDYPDTKTVQHEVRAQVGFKFLKHFGLNLRYIYENFEVDDWAWKDLGNQIANITQTTGGSTILINETTRVAFLNNQYSDYDAHVGAVTLSYHF